MASSLLGPLAVFCSQSQSQRYIKSIRKIGNARRSLAEQPLPEGDDKSTIVETTFDFVLKITNEESKPTIVEMSTGELAPSTASNNQSKPTGAPRHYRIFADYGTDFLWRDPNDVTPEEGDTVLDPEEALASFPSSVLELYDAWVDTYTENFKKRCEDTGDFHATTFSTASEEVAWNVAGLLLAWRIVMAPEVGRMEFTAGGSKYSLEKGKETSVTLAFLQDQVDLLGKGPVG